MKVKSLDHLVLTVRDLDDALAFYVDVLGMQHVTFNGRHAVGFGDQKINLHVAGQEFEPKSASPTPGSGDLCFLISGPLDEAEDHLRKNGISIEEGPVDRTGAIGPLRSLYLRDPDQNLIELPVTKG